jgi:hypothetical protein
LKRILYNYFEIFFLGKIFPLALGAINKREGKMTPPNSFTLKITNEAISLESLRLKDLSDLLILTYRIIEETDSNQSSELSSISLVSLQPGCVQLEFRPHNPDTVFPIIAQISESLNSKDFTKIPQKQIEIIQDFQRMSKRLDSSLEFGLLNGNHKVLSCIAPDEEYIFPRIISGATTIFGKVLNVGGSDPKVRIILPNNSKISCDTSEEIAKKLGSHLYEWVGLDGEAKWNTSDYSLVSFKINSLNEYIDTNVETAFSQISQTFGEYFDQIEDANKFVEDIRG